MSILRFALIENEAELCSFSEKDDKLVFIFDKEIEGYVKIGSTSRAVCGMRAELDTAKLEDGLLSPTLVASGRTVRLPKIKKLGKNILPIYPSPEQYRALCERARALKSRVEELEKTVGELSKKVFGEPLFEFPDPAWQSIKSLLSSEDEDTKDQTHPEKTS